MFDHLTDILSQRHFHLSQVTSADQALKMVQNVAFSLIVISQGEARLDAPELCRALSQQTLTPLLVLSSSRQLFDEVTALEAGADDFVLHSARSEVLLSRIRALLRRMARQRRRELLVVGGLRIDVRHIQAHFERQRLPLTVTEFRILTELASADGKIVTRDQLLHQVWGTDWTAEPRLVDTHMRNLRAKLRKRGAEDLIQTVRGRGYRLAVP